MKLFKPTINTFAGSPVADHDMPCAVCRENHAVLNLNEGIFLPCWQCRAKGFRLRFQPRRWWQFWRRS